MLAVIVGVMLASVGSARNLPYVPAVLHPPVPQEGEYEHMRMASYFTIRYTRIHVYCIYIFLTRDPMR
jgi:hypothetical protein